MALVSETDEAVASLPYADAEEELREIGRLDLMSSTFAEQKPTWRQHPGASSNSLAYTQGQRRRALSGSPTGRRASSGCAQLRVPRILWARESAEIRVIPDVLNDFEIAHLLDAAVWTPSTVNFARYDSEGKGRTSEGTRVAPTRTSSTCTLRAAQTPVVAAVERRVAAIAESSVECLEPLNLVRYEPGQFFKPHHDGGHRSKTVFLYLNDLPPGGGGETHFMRLGIRIPPIKGAAAVWSNTFPDGTKDNRLWHQGLPPVDEVKYGMNCFFQREPCR